MEGRASLYLGGSDEVMALVFEVETAMIDDEFLDVVDES